MNGTTLFIVKALAYFLPYMVMGLLAWGSLKADIKVLTAQYDSISSRLGRIERMLDAR